MLHEPFWRQGDDFNTVVVLTRPRLLRDPTDVVARRSRDGFANCVQFVNDGIRRLHEVNPLGARTAYR